MHQPRNDQFFQWTLLAVSHCKIMDSVRYPLHPAPRLLKEHYGLGIRAKLEFSFAEYYFHIFSHGTFKGRHKQAGCYISPGHHVADTELQILVRFSSNLVAIFMLCSMIVRLKRKGNYFKWIEMGISPLVRS